MGSESAKLGKNTLTPTQLAALEDVWEDKLTLIEVAKKYDIDRETLRLWRKLPAWEAEFDARTADVTAAARRKARKSTETAVNTLVEIASNKDASDGARVQACNSLLKIGGMEPITQVEASVSVTTETLEQKLSRIASLQAQLAALPEDEGDGA